jgi:FtsP/CotA-like multicopper oxidase with cupredoxin domain
MLGLIAVVPPSAQAAPNLSTHNLDYELKALGVAEFPFLIWDPHLKVLSGGNGSDPSNVVLSTDGFLSSQANTDIIPFMINDEFQPFIGVDQNYSDALLGHMANVSVYLRPKQPLRLRIACITTENLCGFKLRKNFPNGTANPDGDMQTFYHLASDGFAFDRAYPEQFFVLAGGMREDVVLLLEDSGMYSFWQQDLADKRALGNKQWPGTGPADQLLAHLLVAGKEYSTNVTAEYLVGLVEGTNHGHFSPGRPKEDDIRPEEVYRTRKIVFSMDAELGKIPFQQYTINAQAYDVNRTDQVIGTAADQRVEEWVIVNNQNMNHPFHIHVNPFQVQEIQSNPCAQENMSQDTSCSLFDTEFYKAVTRQQFRPDKRWRDTVIVPPYGFVRIWQRFSASGNGSAFVGKSVFHCHFLAHEDTGMISNMLLTNDTSKVNAGLTSRSFLRGSAQHNPLQ